MLQTPNKVLVDTYFALKVKNTEKFNENDT